MPRYMERKLKTERYFLQIRYSTLADHNQTTPALGIWGFPKFDNKGVIINARSETASEKTLETA